MPIWVGVLILIAYFTTMIVVVNVRIDAREPDALNALERAGYSNATITEKVSISAWLKGCSMADVLLYRAHATNWNGDEVDVNVCMGLFWKRVAIYQP